MHPEQKECHTLDTPLPAGRKAETPPISSYMMWESHGRSNIPNVPKVRLRELVIEMKGRENEEKKVSPSPVSGPQHLLSLSLQPVLCISSSSEPHEVSASFPDEG